MFDNTTQNNVRQIPFSLCHALVIVFCVFVICLGRPGCDMGLYVVLGFVLFGIAAD
jgi:hypothetical protein